jgi:hypothetical protein
MFWNDESDLSRDEQIAHGNYQREDAAQRSDRIEVVCVPAASGAAKLVHVYHIPDCDYPGGSTLPGYMRAFAEVPGGFIEVDADGIGGAQ